MKAGGGKTKGSAFERLVCKRLSMWLTRGERDDLFWRSAMSGGRATLQLRDDILNPAQSGDLTAISQESYAFAERSFIECKHYRELGIARGFICRTGTLWGFWEIAVRDAERQGKQPILVVRQNRYPIIVIAREMLAIFGHEPLIVLPHWPAEVLLFDTATSYRKIIRRRGTHGTTDRPANNPG